MTRSHRPPGLAVYLFSLLAVGVIAMLASGLGMMLIEAGPLGVAAALVIAAVGLVALAYICVYWWSRIDEAAQEAHKWAWWWGGTAGTALGGVVLIGLQRAMMMGQLADAHFLNHALDSMVSGALMIMLFQVAGYAVAWAAWWLRRR